MGMRGVSRPMAEKQVKKHHREMKKGKHQKDKGQHQKGPDLPKHSMWRSEERHSKDRQPHFKRDTRHKEAHHGDGHHGDGHPGHGKQQHGHMMGKEQRMEMQHMHHMQTLWIYWMLIILGLWMVLSPMTFSYAKGAVEPSGGRDVWLSLSQRVSFM